MNPTIVIPSYWAEGSADVHAPGAYDHSTDLRSAAPEDLPRQGDVLRMHFDARRIHLIRG